MPAVLEREFKTIVISEQNNFAENVLQKMKKRCRSNHQMCSLRKDVPRNFAKFTGKHLCQSLFLNKVEGKQQAETFNFIKKETSAQVFSCEFCGISKNTFFTEHLWATAFEDAGHIIRVPSWETLGQLYTSMFSALVNYICTNDNVYNLKHKIMKDRTKQVTIYLKFSNSRVFLKI